MARAARKSRDGSSPIRRQAIVVIHGQGRQRPMGTMRDFVKVLWSFNTELGPLKPDEQENGRPTWIVPDERTGMFDLHRITTPELGGRRTDFFELYYADLLVDTPIRNLWLWLQRLLWIDPEDVTKRMRWPWALFWIVNLIVFAQFITFLLRIPDLFNVSWVTPLFERGAAPLIAIAAATLVLVLPRVWDRFGWLARVPAWIAFAVIAAAVLAIYWPQIPFRWPAILRLLNPYEWPAILHLLLLIVTAYVVNAAILPTFGGAASYLSAQAETVRSREAIRQRGIKLLKALHDDRDYDRVVVVAHSLGSVLAYDLLQIMWRAVGPTRENQPEPEALAALQAVDAHTSKMAGSASWGEAEVAEHQRLQWEAFDALRQVKAAGGTPETPAVIGGWKISDFVSLGSPLASAQFLITDGVEDFARLKSERLLPTAPPASYEPGEGAVHTADGLKYLHHAAVFSAVRWTNLYDTFHPALVIFGDVISGPVAPQFGPAIRDVDVRNGGFFTHGHYWIDRKGDGSPPRHVAALRDAVGMDR